MGPRTKERQCRLIFGQRRKGIGLSALVRSATAKKKRGALARAKPTGRERLAVRISSARISVRSTSPTAARGAREAAPLERGWTLAGRLERTAAAAPNCRLDDLRNQRIAVAACRSYRRAPQGSKAIRR